MSTALYRKWRSQNFAEVVGQEHVTQTLRNALRDDRVAHAYLFAGPRGTGKTSSARILAKALNCTAPEKDRPCGKCPTCVAITEGRMLDLIEIDAASNNSVDDVRELRDKVGFRPSEGRYKIYIIDECFRYDELVSLADGTKMPIGKIVNNRLPVEVLSYNEVTGQIEPKPITHYDRKLATVPMVRIVFDNHRTIECTINHQFYTPDGKCCAGHLQIGQFVYANYERLSQFQLDAAAGAAIGDGHIALTGSKMRGRLSITQGVAQKDYLDYKYQLLGDMVLIEPAFQIGKNSYSTKGTYRLATSSYPQLAEMHRELYDSSGRKQITAQFLDRLTPLGLALWYIDDGSLVTSRAKYQKKKGGVSYYPTQRSTLSTYGFTVSETQIIVNWLQNKWNIEARYSATAKGPTIWLTVKGTHTLHQLIAAYVPPCMNYKLLDSYKNLFVDHKDTNELGGLAVSIVNKIEVIEAPKYVFNLEVADNHNYFVRDILVANCHMLTLSAFNALLKTLEEPPPHARFILATTEPHKIPATIISRCQRFDFRRIPAPEIAGHLRRIVKEEGFQAEDEALMAIARAAQGGMRDAVSLLDQMFSYGSQTVTFAQVQQVLGAVNAQAVVDFVAALASKNVAAGLTLVQQLVTQGASLVEFCHQVVEHLRGVMVAQLTGDGAVAGSLLSDLPADTVRQMQMQAKQMAQPATIFAIKRFSEAATELKGGFQPQLPLEMALIESIFGPAVSSGAALNPAVASTAMTSQPSATTTNNQPAPTSAVHPPPVVPATEAKLGAITPPANEPPPLDAAAVKKLRAQWKEFQAIVKTQCGQQAWAALNAVKDVAIGERNVTFAFGNNQFSHDIVAKIETLAKVTGVLSNFLGRPVVLECQMGDQARLSGSSRSISEKKTSDHDPLLDYAVATLGAQVVQ